MNFKGFLLFLSSFFLLFLVVNGQTMSVSPHVVGVGGNIQILITGLNYSQAITNNGANYCNANGCSQSSNAYCSLFFYDINQQLVVSELYNPLLSPSLAVQTVSFNQTHNASVGEVLTVFNINNNFQAEQNYTIQAICNNQEMVNTTFGVTSASSPASLFNIVDYLQSNASTLGISLFFILFVLGIFVLIFKLFK
jgi:hypothetical protein